MSAHFVIKTEPFPGETGPLSISNPKSSTKKPRISVATVIIF
ncbi:hypothetical protein VCRA2113O206_720003 [Vibrio crassostreae]|uniref:Uncharacterized protein n=1 Tax=Vibrio splendidus TaxID=29497 RepID=A0A0H3ZXV0_VIBSP|nr:hypothetical protein [Vibrio splendidus]CAK2227731.1 hypothetical protein VCRA2113O206_720003 [Vibrio crassostreae]CAK3107515.1 hypothetical protein VCRA2119O146_770004 [Vibrio crassostreae]CAK3523808.1 hypothetical protein VCRA2128O94_700004 [Vibrio crassostreae]